jgi:hypothetical protein
MSSTVHMSRRRFWLVVGILVLATVIALVGALTLWTKRQLLDNQAWRNSSAALLQHQEVRDALANQLVSQLYNNVNVEQELENNLPTDIKKLAPVISAALQTASVRAAETLLESSRGQQLWIEVSGRAHQQIVNVLEGKNVRNIETANGEIVLNLRPVLLNLADRLGLGSKLQANLSADVGRIVLVKSADLKNAQRAVRALKVLSVVTALLALILYGVAIWLAIGHRMQALMWCGLSFAFVGFILLVVRRYTGDWITGSLVKTESNRPAVTQVWLVETNLMRDLGLLLITYGIFAMIAAWLGGHSHPAIRLRERLAPTFHRHAAIVYGAAAFLFLIWLTWGPSAGSRRIGGELVLAALFFTGLWFWRRQMLLENPQPALTPAPPPP